MINYTDLYLFYVDHKRYVAHIPSCLIFDISSELYDDLERNQKDSKYYSLSLENLTESVLIHQRKVQYTAIDSQPFKPSCIVLNISGKCNLSCKYCFSQDANGFKFHSMTVSECIDAISFMVKQCPEKKQYSINFFGGEPFLESEVLMNTVSSIKELYPDKTFQFSITTNGTIMDDRLMDYISLNHISLLISFDGPKDIVNEFRQHKNSNLDTYDIVIANTEQLKRRNIPFCFRATVIPSSHRLMETVLFFESLKIPYYLVPCFNPGNGNKDNYLDWDNDIFSEEYEQMSCYFLSKIKNDEPIYCYSFISKIKSINQQFFSKYSCGVGVNLFSVTNGGNMFSCMNLATHPETIIGNIYSGINEAAWRRFRPFDIESINECKDCIIRYQCVGGCLSERYDSNTGKVLPPDKRMCGLKTLIWKSILRTYQNIKINNPKFLRELPETMPVE